MHLIQIFLPLQDNAGTPFPFDRFEHIKHRLTDEFGGVTAFLNSPAEGVWRESPRHFVRDDVVIFEVMTERFDRDWWKAYKKDLESAFEQHEIVIRQLETEIL